MGSFLDKPKTEKTTSQGQGNNLYYGLSAMQGWRIEMEDSHSSLIGLPKAGLEHWSFFAVFDGHAGATVSKYSSDELIKSILDADPTLFDDLAKQTNAINRPNSSLVNIQQQQQQNSLNTTTTSPTKSNQINDLINDQDNTTINSTTNSLNNTNTSLNSNSTNLTNDSTHSLKTSNSNSSLSTTTKQPTLEETQNRLKKAIRQGFLNLDDKIRHRSEFERGEDKSGSTAVACLISPTHVYLINCGDSRAISVSDNQIVLTTHDHKPINPAERERIHNAGGSVMIQRVNGSLAVSRALGDYEYKSVEGRGPCEQLVSPEPEIYIHDRSDKDEFVVLACDGIWDVMSNEDLKEYIHARLKVTNDLVKISNDVLDMCLSKGSRDNMSIIIVSFPGAPKVVPEEVEKDNNCNEKIENRVKELIESNNTGRIEFSQVLQAISQEKWDDFPPVGGFHAKQSLIEEIYNRLSPPRVIYENF